MAQFYDDFERANGAPGNGWVAGTGTHSISGGSLVGSTSFSALNTNIASSGRLEARAHIYQNNYQATHGGPVVKGRAGSDDGFCLTVYGTAAPFALRIVSSAAPSGSVLKSYTLPGNPPPYYELALVWELGHLSGYFNGALVIEADSGAWATNTLAGVSGSSSYAAAADVTLIGGAAPQLTVSPPVIPNFGACSTVTLTGTDGTWTPGTPGSPTFTVDHGTISAQTVVSPTQATLTYCPGTYLGAVTFTDPTTGATAVAIVSSDPGIVSPPGGDERPSVLGAAILDRAGATPPVEGVRVWTNQDVVTTAPILMNQNDALRYIVQYIWFLAGGPAPDGGVNASALLMDWVSGGYTRGSFIDTAPSNTSVKQDLAAALSSLGDLAAQLTGAVDLLGGDSPILSHRDLKIAIDGIQTGGDNSAVLDALAAIRGDTTTSLYTLLSSLAGIRTVHSYNLQDILDAIHLLPTSLDGGYTTADRLANAAGFVGVLAAIAALATVEAEDAAASSGSLTGIIALATELAGGVASILAMLESLKALLGGGANEYRAPVWPGEAHVEWGEAIAIESNQPVIGEMHGVVVSITGCEKGTRLFGYDGITCYSHVGALGFCSDLGHMEPFQALGPTTAIYTVKTMASAFACRLFRGRGVRGTIRPWKVKAE